ncbi:MAG: ribosome maturation factor RimM, partial [Acidimicrobiales bacterium]
DHLLEIGRIDNVHGLRGEVLVGLVTNMVDARTAAGTRLWAESEWLTVKLARRHKNKWLMTFDGVDGREEAERLRGRTLEAEPLGADVLPAGAADGPATEVVAFVHELIGKRLVDQTGVDQGEVVSVVDNPASDLLELEDGRLIPLSFYQRHDADAIIVDVPPGLLDESEAVNASDR